MTRTVGQLIREGMARMGLSAEALAAKMNVDRSTVSRWRNDKLRTGIDRDTAEKLDRVLGMSGRLVRAWQVQTTGSLVADWRKPVGELEKASHTVEVLVPEGTPGYLYTPAYAELVLRQALYPGTDDQIRAEAVARSRRRDVLAANGDPWLVTVFYASVLRRIPDDIRTEQVRRIVSLIDQGRTVVHLFPDHALMGVIAPVLLFHLCEGGVVVGGEHVRGFLDYPEDKHTALLAEQARRVLGAAMGTRETQSLLEGML